jgi:YkoY family integral membrane protein
MNYITHYFANIPEQWQWIIEHPEKSWSIVFNLILLETLLSVDNAAVIATMVMDLPEHQRPKALRYGILGAYIFRGLALIFATLLVSVWWLKPLGGLYLLYLAIDYFFKAKSNTDDSDNAETNTNAINDKWYYRMSNGWLGQFWATVIAVEVMDMAFSIDNVFAAAAFTKNIVLIWLGVFIGILAMRFVAQGFVKLLEKFPFLESVAFMVIGVLGLKLTLATLGHLDFSKNNHWVKWMESEHGDMMFSILTALLFVLPVASSYFLNFPKRNRLN